MEILWEIYGMIWKSSGNPMEIVRKFFGSPIEILWVPMESNGNPEGILWKSCGIL
jgi:hypothetical protein